MIFRASEKIFGLMVEPSMDQMIEIRDTDIQDQIAEKRPIQSITYWVVGLDQN